MYIVTKYDVIKQHCQINGILTNKNEIRKLFGNMKSINVSTSEENRHFCNY